MEDGSNDRRPLNNTRYVIYIYNEWGQVSTFNIHILK